MYKFAHLTDLHLADQPPVGRQPGYQDQLFAKLEGVAEICNKANVEVVTFGGDIFHTKRPDRVSHGLVTRLMDVLKNDFEAEILICVGNHDLSEAGIDSLPRQPLGSIFQSDIANPLITAESWYISRRGKVNVLFLGRHFSTERDLDPEYYLVTKEEAEVAKRGNANVVIMVSHGSVVPPGEDPIYPHISMTQIDWEESAIVPDLFLANHLHEDYGIHKVKDGPIYVNLGSFGRPSRNQVKIDSRDFLMVTISDSLQISLERIPIPNMLPAADVFLEKAEEYEDEALAEFAEQLASSIILEEQSLDEALAALGDIPPKVRARLKKYLEDAGV